MKKEKISFLSNKYQNIYMKYPFCHSRFKKNHFPSKIIDFYPEFAKFLQGFLIFRLAYKFL